MPNLLGTEEKKVDRFVCQCTDTAITRNQEFGAESMLVNKNQMLGAEVYEQKSDVKLTCFGYNIFLSGLILYIESVLF